MKTRLTLALAGATGLLAAGLALASSPAASATTTPSTPSFATCKNLEGWYVNGDEADRKPEATVAGLKFEPADLIHRKVTGITVETLGSGSYTASPSPDQDSFFSVEVADSDGSGYGTLRYNRATHLWNLVTGGQFYENASAAALVEMPPVDRSHKVISFGVGYTKSPPGTVTTTVSRVVFNGNEYPLTCAPPVTTPPTTTPTTAPATPATTAPTKLPPNGNGGPTTPATTRPTTVPATTRPTTAPVTTAPMTQPTTVEPTTESPTLVPAGNETGGGALPLTGPSMGLFIALGLAVLGTGTVLTILARRRKVSFEN